MLLLEDRLPRVLRNIVKLASEGMVPHLPMGARQDRVGRWDLAKLELGVRWEGLRCQDLVRGSLLVWVVFPLDVAAK